jgi:hypothetical protein
MCADAIELLAEYNNATQAYARLRKELEDLAANSSLSMFAERLAKAEEVRHACENALLAFRSHKAEHGC